MSLLINLTLIVILSTILVLPVVTNHFVISQNGGVGGVVAGVSSISEQEVNIIPNLRDFNGHVSFDPSPIKDGKYQDLLGLRVFQRQKASYRGVYSVYNQTQDQVLTVEIATPGIDSKIGTMPFERLVISIMKGSTDQVLSHEIAQGDTLIQVEDINEFKEGEKILLGDELAEVIVISTDGLVVTPLTKAHPIGESIYPEPIVLDHLSLVNPRTRSITLGPGEKATVDAVVEGTADLLRVRDEMVDIPLVFKVDVE